MSAELMIKAYEIIEEDGRLTPVDKLLLLRWAWKTSDPAQPYEIKFRTVARELGVSRNAVKASVKRLSDYGYLHPVSVKVVAGPAFQLREKTGHSETPVAKRTQGHSVTRGGSVSDPQRGQSVTPLQRKLIKKGAREAFTRFELTELRQGKKVWKDGRYVQPTEKAVVQALNAERR